MAVVLIHGDKGGVGKSVIAATFGEYCLSKSDDLLVIDADTQNRDVARYFTAIGRGTVVEIGLRDNDGWGQFANILESNAISNVVVNMPGNIGADVAKQAEFFEGVCDEIGVSRAMLFAMNTEADSVNLLRYAMDAYKSTPIVAVMNTFFGDKFPIWDESKTRKNLLARGGKEVRFPELWPKAMEATFKAQKPVSISGSGLAVAERTKGRQFLAQTAAVFDSIADFVGVGRR